MAKKAAVKYVSIEPVQKVEEIPFVGVSKYIVVKPYRQSEKGIPLLGGYILRVESDDWYQVYSPMDEKMHFRIGPKYMKVIDRLNVIKPLQ